MEISKTFRESISSITEVTREENFKSEKTEKQEYSIGPGDKLYFYQQFLEGPGIYFALDTTSVTSSKKTADDDRDVDIEVVSECVRFYKYIDVAYGDNESDAPEDRVREFWDKSDDINHGQKGK